MPLNFVRTIAQKAKQDYRELIHFVRHDTGIEGRIARAIVTVAAAYAIAYVAIQILVGLGIISITFTAGTTALMQ